MAIRTRSPRRERGVRPTTNRNVVTEASPSRLSAFSQRFNINQLPVTVLFARASWVCLLAIFYVFFQNRFDKLSYQTAQSKSKMNERRAVYITKKEAYSLQSKQSEITKRLSYRGLDKSTTPPIKIEVIED